jgi:hypothetical protein
MAKWNAIHKRIFLFKDIVHQEDERRIRTLTMRFQYFLQLIEAASAKDHPRHHGKVSKTHIDSISML